MRILIANRGEIARRIIRTAHRLGHETVAAFADPDADAPFVAEATRSVRLGPAALQESYLSIDALVSAARSAECDAVHPGYGFLSENAEFARSVIGAGAVWVGPAPDAIERMGSKIEARRLAAAAGVAVIPGFDESQEDSALAGAAEAIGYPVLVKAAAGGGGKGIRIVASASEFDDQLEAARTEARRAFGDEAMIVERYIQRPRHVEVQVVGDKHGTVVELGTRECSVQRRYQKVLEEAPAPNLPDETRSGLRTAAVDLARSIGYDSTGTVEFVVDDETGEFFFLEMNTRLQVEHPVTEEVTGLDLVELQLRVASGDPVGVDQSDVVLEGHALEARINAEDAFTGFTPDTGAITHLRVPQGVRWDSGIELGSSISPHYDSMVAKLIVHGRDRAAALSSLRRALDELIVGGPVTTAGFHRWLVDQPPVVAGRVTTRFLDESEIPTSTDQESALAIAARAWGDAQVAMRPVGAWSRLTDARFTPHRCSRPVALVDRAGREHELGEASSEHHQAVLVDVAARSVAVNVAGHTHTFTIPTRSERWAPSSAVGHGHAGAVVAPFPALVTEVRVAPGDEIAGGDVIIVIEAMKMLHSLTAAGPGVVATVEVEAGDQIESNQVLVTFAAGEGPQDNGEEE